MTDHTESTAGDTDTMADNAGVSTGSGNTQSSDLLEESALRNLDVSHSVQYFRSWLRLYSDRQ
jgi:hypothetical protein